MAIPSITWPLKQVNSLNGHQVKTLVIDDYPILISASSERVIAVLVSRKVAPLFCGPGSRTQRTLLVVGIYPTEISGDCPLSLPPILTLISRKDRARHPGTSFRLLGAARYFPKVVDSKTLASDPWSAVCGCGEQPLLG